MRQLIREFGHLVIRLSELGKSRMTLDLSGDRHLEWSWVAAHLPDNPGEVLDFGCGVTFLGLTAAMKGGEVIALDRQPVQMWCEKENLNIQIADILDFSFEEKKFDVILNCSSIEHVGLADRYDSTDVPDGDLVAMGRLRHLLRVPGGIMILTVPVGRDSVFPPFHRVYGNERLNLLLRGFRVVKKEFWSKRVGLNIWTRVSQQEALATQPSECFYALGFFILKGIR